MGRDANATLAILQAHFMPKPLKNNTSMLGAGGTVKSSSRDLQEAGLKARTLKNTAGINLKTGQCPVYCPIHRVYRTQSNQHK